MLRIVAWVVLIQLVLMNLSAALYAYRFTHFYDGTEKAVASQNFFSKTWRLFSGPKFYKASAEPEPPFPFETVLLKTPGGLNIHSWYSSVDSAKGSVILLHGISANKTYLFNEADAFRRMGWNILLLDFRGHGLSQGNTTTFGIDETEETAAAFSFLANKGEKKIILYGTSLGAAVAMRAVAENKVQPSAIIAEMPFASLQNHLESRARIVGFPSQPFAFLVTLWMGIERGYNGFSHKPANYARDVKCPVLLQWGEKDEYVTRQETEAIFTHLPASKKLAIYPAGHESFLNRNGVQWMQEVGSFLQALP